MYIVNNKINNLLKHDKNTITNEEAVFKVNSDGQLMFGDDTVKLKAWYCDSCQTCDGNQTNDKKYGCKTCNGCDSCNGCVSCHGETAKTRTCSSNVSDKCIYCYNSANNGIKVEACGSCNACQKGQSRDKGTSAGEPDDGGEKCTRCFAKCYGYYNYSNPDSISKKACRGYLTYSECSSSDGNVDVYGVCHGCYDRCYGCLVCTGCNDCNYCVDCLTCDGCTLCVDGYSSRSDCAWSYTSYFIASNYNCDGEYTCKNCYSSCNFCISCHSGCQSCPSCTGLRSL